jgi:DNA-binding FrmR family transcriptional regulator
MPHGPEEKKRALARVRRIRGQVEALERSLEAEAECGAILQQLAAVRGAVNGLMGEVLESHLRETLQIKPSAADANDPIDVAIALVRSYLK